MPKLFSFLKNRKSLLSVFLLLVSALIIAPQIAFASWYNPFSWGSDIATAVGNAFLNVLLLITFLIPQLAALALTAVCKILLMAVIGFAVNGTSYTNSFAVQTGWPVVRDLANMMIVLGFIVIGIATALRIQEYEAKKLLKNLIIVALLVNFSLLICGIFIDATNILMTFFFGNPNDISSWVSTALDIGKLLSNIGSSPFVFAPQLLGLLLFESAATGIYIIYSILILARVLAIWCLVILSPLAFVCYVFPATRSIWQMWWKNFFQWCIVIMPLGLFYYIGSKMIVSNGAGQQFSLSGASLQTYVSNALSQILVPATFLYIGFVVSLQFAPAGASAILNFANKQGKKMLSGAAKGAMEMSGRAFPEQRERFLAARDRLTEATGFGGAKVGHADDQKSKRFKDAKDRMDKMRDSTNPAENARFEGLVKNGRGIQGAAAAASANEAGSLTRIAGGTDQTNARLALAKQFGHVATTGMESTQIADVINDISHPLHNAQTVGEGVKTLMKRGQLELIDPGMRQAAIGHAMEHGLRVEEAEKADYHYAPQNQARVQRIMRANPGFNQAQAETAAQEQALDENIGNMSHAQLRNIDPAQLTAKRLDKLTPDKIGAFQYASQAHRDIVRSQFEGGGELRSDMNSAYTDYKAATASGDAVKAGNRYTEFKRLLSLHKAAGRLPQPPPNIP